jgi:hypothetical protein
MSKKNIGPFLAPSKGLSIAGKYVYAYSGQYQIGTSAQTLLLFSTGSVVIDAVVQVSGPLKWTDPASGDKSNFQLSFNDVPLYIMGQCAANSGYTNPLSDSVRIIIPPHTTVKVEVDSGSSTADVVVAAIISGEIVA